MPRLEDVLSVEKAALIQDPDFDEIMICPVCGQHSGNDWSQCQDNCPVPFSPHYKGAKNDQGNGTSD